ncbi:MAG: hypothetical protein ABGW98_01510, partial [Myxococcales bacterium]
GTSLRVSCLVLVCEQEIPVWENFCAECGGNQKELTSARRAELDTQREQAESLRGEYAFDESLCIAREIAAVEDSRLQHLKGWAEGFLPKIEEGRQQQLTRIGGLLDEALAHQQAHDYVAGLRVLEQVPEILRETRVQGHDQTTDGLRTKLQGTLDEIQRLNGVIRYRVKKRGLNGLQAEVEKLQGMQPSRSDLKELQEQLVERDRKLKATRDAALAEAKDLFESQDYEGCLRQIARIDASLLAEDITALRETAKYKRDRLKSLRDSIAASVKAKQFGGLLAQVEECLSLQSGAEVKSYCIPPHIPRASGGDLLKLREQLVEREEKNAAAVANVLQNATALREQCRFEEAVAALQRIPEELATLESSNLLHNCQREAEEAAS